MIFFIINIFSSKNYRRIIGFTSSILESDKMSQQLLTPVMTPLQKTGLFKFYIINTLLYNLLFIE